MDVKTVFNVGAMVYQMAKFAYNNAGGRAVARQLVEAMIKDPKTSTADDHIMRMLDMWLLVKK